ncbi:hypothetical protein E6C70_05650 [Glaciibacter flavus]|uniref:Uncharacterized protein n=1 Tax=Orlajensenia flava TaxID=2565934 RepID=A0A4S4G0B7_9MICO|nr:hypothetical protein [Glaciibacter flavus]THG35526.1 hypothetical protein E6C70_05650 [Glaciibacter flavus]
MTSDTDEPSDIRAALVARVYSRAGQDEPLEEHVDPLSGEPIMLRRSEWMLLEHDHRAAARPANEPEDVAETTEPGAASSAPALDDAADAAAVTAPRIRRRLPLISAVALGVVVGVVLVLGVRAVAMSTSSGAEAAGAPAIVHTLVPGEDARSWASDATMAVKAPASPAFDVFRDPGHDDDTFPDWLRRQFALDKVASVYLPQKGERDVQVYAATAGSSIACLILLVPSNGMTWRCDSDDHVIAGGMRVSAPVPPDLPVGGNGDPDRINATLPPAQTFSARWMTDGSFRMTESPFREE